MNVVQKKILSNSSVSTTPTALATTAFSAGNLLVLAYISTGAQYTITSLTDDKNNNWTHVPNAQLGASGQLIDLWYEPNIAGGNTTITITVSGNGQGSNIDLLLFEVTGADSTSPLKTGSGTTLDNSGNPVPPVGVALTPDQTNELLITCSTPYAISYTGVSSPWTGDNMSQFTSAMAAYYIDAPLSTQQAAWTPTTAQDHISSGAIFVPAPTGPSAKQKASTTLVF